MTQQYLIAAAITLLVILLMMALIALGWRNRLRRQADVPAPAALPASLADPRLECEGMYVVTTSAGDRLDRVAVHGLGVRGPATLSVGSDGVAVLREGGASFFVPAAELELAETTNGMVGKVVEKDGIVVMRHRHDGFGFDTGFRPRYHAEQAPLLSALQQIITAPQQGHITGKEAK